MSKRIRALLRAPLGVRSLVVVFLVALLALAGSPPVQAQVFAEPVIELVPIGQAIGDGESTLALHAIALGADGSPLTGMKVKPSATGGTIGGAREVAPGTYRFEWTPPLVQETRNIEISVKGKTSGGEAFARRWALPVAPPLSHQVAVAANPGMVVLGQDPTATISVTLAGGASQPLSGVDLEFKMSSGVVENVTNLGEGRFTALFTPPKQLFPHVALITLVDRRDPTRTYGALAVPLVGKANFPVVAVPNSNVIVRVADREFGPIPADAAGRATVPLVVPPGVSKAIVVSVLPNNQRAEQPLDLKIPPTRRVQLFPTPRSIPGDPTSPVPVRAFVTTPLGAPDSAARVAFTATAGTMSDARHEGNGVYAATFTPPFGSTAAQATIQVSVEDTASRQSDAATVDLVPARPSAVELNADPPSLDARATAFQVFAEVKGPDGTGMTGRSITYIANGAQLRGSVKEMGGGQYQAFFNTTGNGPVEAVATVRSSASGNPLRRVLVFPSRSRLPNDGLSSAMLTILTLDEFGYPVAGMPVALARVLGDGSVPDTAVTDESGIAQVHYTAGRQAGFATIMAVSGDSVGACGILQAPAEVAPTLELPPSGTEADIKLALAWRAIVKPLRVSREGAAAVVAAAPVAAPPPPPPPPPPGPAVLGITSQPPQLQPGGAVMLVIQATDAQGKGFPGGKFKFLASTGTVGPMVDLGGGQYQATLFVPQNAPAAVDVTIATLDGRVTRSLSIPVAGATAAATPAPPPPAPIVAAPVAPTPVAPVAPAPAPAPVAPTTSTTPPAGVAVVPPPKKSDRPWLRLRAGYLGGFYHYTQKPVASQGPLWKDSITFGMDVTEPAPTAGAGVRARAWLPAHDWVGLDTGFRGSFYSIQIPFFGDEPIPDWVVDYHADALARYAFEAGGGSSRLHVGGRAGLGFSDFMVYKESTEGSRLAIQYDPLPVFGLDLGAEFGAEIGNRLFGVAGATMGLNGELPPYLAAVDVSIGYALLDNVFLDLGLDLVFRNTSVFWIAPDDETKKVGTIDDKAQLFGLGLGFQI